MRQPLLCEPHHLAHHNGETTIEATASGRFRFTRADGVDLPVHLNPAEYITTSTRLEHEHDHVAARAATTRWGGERLERDYAISVIAHRRESAARESAA